MKKQNLLKAMLILILSIVAAVTACFGFAACKPDNGENNGDVNNDGDNDNNNDNDGDDDNDGDNTGDKLIDVVYELKVKDIEKQTLKEDMVKGIFTIAAGTEIRSRNDAVVNDVSYGSMGAKLNGDKAAITLNAPTAGKLVLIVKNGSSNVATQKLVMTKPDASTREFEYDGKAFSKIEYDVPEAGAYKFTCRGTTDVHYASFTAKVKDTPLESIQITGYGVNEYYVGQPFDGSKITADKVYSETHRTYPLDINAANVTVDYSNYDATVAGEYEITLTLKEGEKTYSDKYTVTVYGYDSLTLGKNATVTGKNSYNSTYENVALRQLYLKGEQFSAEGLTVKLNASLTLEGGQKKTKEFILPASSGYSLSGNSTQNAGKQTVTVSYSTNEIQRSQTFDIYVLDPTAINVEGQSEVVCTVNAAITDAQVGVINSGAYQFKTIQQAIDFIEALKLDSAVVKTINLAAGKYNEKLEINVPNVCIIGAGKETTIIEWNSLYGVADESGFVQVTDSTATLNVREKATGFTMTGVTVSNYFNSLAAFDKEFGAGYKEHRALAMLIQADKVKIDGCILLGYQDTLELFTGRQYISNTLISGTTDFIFGTNNITYFKNCEIKSITVADSEKHGGYITAFKGINSSSKNDYVQYGAVFDGCNFTCENGVANGLTAIGRAWGTHAAVAVVNSTLGAHISKTAYSSGITRDARYVEMNAKPTDSNVKFVEYNNTGAGAIAQSQAGVTVLTNAAEGAKYSDISLIFGTNNGGLTWSEAWNPLAATYVITVKTGDNAIVGTISVQHGASITQNQITELLQDGQTLTGVYSDSGCQTAYGYGAVTANTDIYVTYDEVEVARNVVYDIGNCTEALEGATGEYNGITIDATNGKFRPNGGGNAQINAGTVLIVPVSEGGKLVITWHSASNLGTAAYADIVYDYTAGTATVTIKAGQNPYIIAITVINEVTDTNATWNFSGNGENDCTESVASGETKTINKLLVGGSFATNGSGWYAVANGTSLTLSVKAGAKVQYIVYKDSGFNLQVGDGEVAPATLVDEAGGNKEITVTATEDCLITLTATQGSYVRYIHVTYAA